jgi:hypothetical protein
MTRILCIGACVSLILMLHPAAAVASGEPIPTFARKYKVSCSLCHTVAPKLSAFGEEFAGNGFRMASQEIPRDTLDTGDRLLHLLKDVPLAVRLDAYLQGYTGGNVATDLQGPYNLKLLSGGTISNSLSYYFYFFLFERGEIGGIEDAFIYWNDIGGATLDGVVGQFQVSDPMFKRELRLEFQDYAVYRARVGLQPADLTYDRGIMAIGDAAGFTLTAEVINGNGRGEAEPNRRLDNDPMKNLFGHLTRDLTPNVRLGAMGYYGRQDGAPDETAPTVTNTLWMGGADATISAGAVELNLQYIHRQDTNPLFEPNEETAYTNGGLAELILHKPGSRWYGVALYNIVDCSRPILTVRLGELADIERYQTVTAGAGWLAKRNFRLAFEGMYDIERDRTRWTVGLVTAF